MKRGIIYLCICVVIGASAVAEEPDYRTFTSTDGQTVQAHILSYEAAKGRIQIEREGGKTAWVKPNIFSDADQTYIGEWVAAERVMSEKNLRVSVKECRRERFWDGSDTERGEILYYEVKVENRSGQDIRDLQIEYRVFIDVSGFGDLQDSDKLDGGLIDVGPIGKGQIKTVYTKDIRVLERYVNSREISGYYASGRPLYSYSMVKVSKEVLLGVWFKILGPEVEGSPAVRDIYCPEKLQDMNLQWIEQNDLPLAIIQSRGKAFDEKELLKWILDAVSQLKVETDVEKLEEISKTVEIFYAEELDPRGRYAMVIALIDRDKKMYEQALLWLDKAVREEENGGFRPLLLISEIYASAPDPDVRDGEKAVEYAKKLQEISKNEEYVMYKIIAKSQLAAAYAQGGQFDLAVETQMQVISELPDVYDKVRSIYIERLELYRSNKVLILEKEDRREWHIAMELDDKALVPEPKWVKNEVSIIWSEGIESDGSGIAPTLITEDE